MRTCKIVTLLLRIALEPVPLSVVYAHLPEQQSEEQREEALLTRSDLWKTLFRGGYMVGKLTRSLSGAHVSPSPTDCSHHITAVLACRRQVLLIPH